MVKVVVVVCQAPDVRGALNMAVPGHPSNVLYCKYGD